MDRSRIKNWLALGALKGIRRRSIHDALEAIGPAEKLFACTDKEFNLTPPTPITIDPKLMAAINSFDKWDEIERVIDRTDETGVRILTLADESYPKMLRSIDDPPLTLFVKGPGTFNSPSVAVVGTRHPTPYGRNMAENIARGLAQAKLTVVSGMARGCDSAAHRGALTGGGETIAVLGTGIDVVYPKENKKLYDEIASLGLLVSEFPFGTAPLKGNFPRRNRIVGGISLGVLVAEAPLRSGAMMTARLALEEGREVFAIPGPVSSPKSAGTNKLIKDGAYLVEEVQRHYRAAGFRHMPGRQANS